MRPNTADRTSEMAFLVDVFDASLEGIILVDLSGDILQANPASHTMFGYDDKELVQQRLDILIPQEPEAQQIENNVDYSSGMTFRDLDLKSSGSGVKKDGSQFPLEIRRKRTWVDGQKATIHFVVDVSTQKDLTESERRFEESQSIGHIGSWYWNFQTGERSWSDEFYRICGLDPKDDRLNSDTARDFIHPDDREDIINALSFSIENRTFFKYKARFLRPDGTSRHVIAMGKTVYAENGKSLYMLGTVQDITEQRELGDILYESNRKFSTLIDNLPGMVYRCKNDKHWTMEFLSSGCLSVTGYKSNEFTQGRIHLGQVVLKEDRERTWNDVQAALFKKEPFDLHYRIRTKDGRVRHLWEQGVGIFDQSGEFQCIEGFISDMTEQIRTAQELVTSEVKTRAILDVLPDMLFIINDDGEYLEMFAAQADQLVVPEEEMIGMNIGEIYPQKVHQQLSNSMAKAKLDKLPQVIEYSLNLQDGLNWFEARIVHFDDHKFLTIVRNITDKKANEEILFVRNSALEAAASGIVITDARKPDQPIIYCNDAFKEMSGYDLAEIHGKNCRFLQKNDRDQKEIRIMSAAIEKDSKCSVVLRNYRKDGSQFWNQVSITPVFNEHEILTHFIGVQNDVTVRKQEELFKSNMRSILEMIILQEPLKALGDRLIESLENAIPDSIASILLLNSDQKRLYCLSAPNLPVHFAETIEGILIGPSVGSCGTAAHLKREVIVSDIASDPLWKDFKMVAMADGLCACWSFPLLSSTQDVLGTFAVYSKQIRLPSEIEKEVINDMIQVASIALEQHLTSVALTESQEQLILHAQGLEERVLERTMELNDMVQDLVEANSDLEDQMLATEIAEHDAQVSKRLLSNIAKNFPKALITVANEDYIFDFVEGEELERSGISSFVSEGSSVDKIKVFPEARIVEQKEQIRNTLDGEHLSFEIKLKGRDYIVNTTPLRNKEGKITQALFVYIDNSDQKKVESEILRTLEKEQELGELKSRFVAMASHEFRTPLSVILSSALLIEKQNNPGLEDKRMVSVERIRKNVNNLVIILNDFLSLSKLGEGKVELQTSPFDLLAFAQTILEDVGTAKRKGQNLRIKYNNPALEVKLDKKLMHHVLQNLLTNAIKYSPENSEIIIDIKSDADRLRIQVIDQGIGIPEDEQEKLFQRFFRATNSTNIQGTGLGLVIAKQYVELMGGILSFTSKLNEGSTFTIDFSQKMQTS